MKAIAYHKHGGREPLKVWMQDEESHWRKPMTETSNTAHALRNIP